VAQALSGLIRCKYTINFLISQEYEQKRREKEKNRMGTALFCRFLGSKSKEYEQGKANTYKNTPTKKDRSPKHKLIGQNKAANSEPNGLSAAER
jgi:hypothetical protein